MIVTYSIANVVAMLGWLWLLWSFATKII